MKSWWVWLKSNIAPLSVALVVVIAATVLYTAWTPPPQTGDGSDDAQGEGLLRFVGWVTVLGFWPLFLYLFTGDPKPKMQGMLLFAYGFTLVALISSILPFVVFHRLQGLPKAMEKSPIAVLVGCSMASDGVPDEIACDGENRYQWVLNIGGTAWHPRDEPGDEESGPSLEKQDPAAKAEVEGKAEAENAKNASEPPASGQAVDDQEPSDKKVDSVVPAMGWPQVQISGGLVVPLYFIVLSLMGGAIAMTRRVPEYQRRWKEYQKLEEDNRLDQLNKKEGGPLSPAMAREKLIFQIMQVISAPLLAVVAYHLIEPEKVSTTVAMGFAAGFGSEAILMLIRSISTSVGAKSVS